MKISLNQPNGFPTLFAPDGGKYLDIQNPSTSVFNYVDIENKRNRFNPYTLNYGTVVGVAGENFVVVAGDTRLSEGYSIVTRN